MTAPDLGAGRLRVARSPLVTAPDLQTPQLVETSGAHVGRVHPVPYGEHLIGRDGQVGVRLDHEDISRRHARLRVSPEGATIEDLDSKNGVWVEGQRLREPRSLGHDERFSLGKLELRLSHPAAQVSRALAAGGETTLTSQRLRETSRPELRSLIVPLLGVVVFGTLVVVLLLR